MYTHTQNEREKLNFVIVHTIMPALQRTIADASRIVVYESEGFHPDIAYGESLREAADEITSRLVDYFAGLTFRDEREIYSELSPEKVKQFLEERQPLLVE